MHLLSKTKAARFSCRSEVAHVMAPLHPPSLKESSLTVSGPWIMGNICRSVPPANLIRTSVCKDSLHTAHRHCRRTTQAYNFHVHESHELLQRYRHTNFKFFPKTRKRKEKKPQPYYDIFNCPNFFTVGSKLLPRNGNQFEGSIIPDSKCD